MSFHCGLALFFLVSGLGCAIGEKCYYYSSFSSNYLYCNYGCCGTYYNQYCCVNVGPIVGGVIGFLIFIGIIITIISCLCCACCQSTRRSFAGTVFRTNPNPTITTVGVQQPGYLQPYVVPNTGYQSMQTQPPAGNVAYIQGDVKTGYPAGAAPYQAGQAPPPYMG